MLVFNILTSIALTLFVDTCVGHVFRINGGDDKFYQNVIRAYLQTFAATVVSFVRFKAENLSGILVTLALGVLVFICLQYLQRSRRVSEGLVCGFKICTTCCLVLLLQLLLAP